MLHDRLERWGKSVHRLRWMILAVWLLVIAGSGMIALTYSDVLSGGGWDIPGSETTKVKELFAKEFDGKSGSSVLLVYKDEKAKAEEPAFREKLDQAIDFLMKEEGISDVYSVLNAAETMKPQMIGSDGRTTYAFVNLSVTEDYAVNLMPKIQERFVDYTEKLGAKAYLIGAAALWGDVSVYSQKGLATAEMIVLPLVFLILLFVFRSVVATVTPIIVTIAAVIAGMGLIYGVGSRVELSVFVTNSAMMLGMGVGIDYSLFMVNRFRLELAAHGDVNRAMGTAMRTSGHTVLFSGITVIAAMLALFVVDIPAIKAMGFGAVAVVIFAVLATLSLLPAVLVMLGSRINKWTIPNLFTRSGKPSTFWRSWAHRIMKRPVLFLFLTLLVMGILALPSTDMKLNTNDISILPEESSVRKGAELYEEAFQTGGTTVANLTVRVPNGRIADEKLLTYFMKLHKQLGEQKHVKHVSSPVSFLQGMEPAQAAAFLQGDPSGWPKGLKPMMDLYVSRNGDVAVFDITFSTSSASDESKELVDRIKDQVIPASGPPAGLEFLLGGDTPQAMEMNEAIGRAFLPTLLVMLGLIYVILLVTFRSVVLPLKAIAMNLISVFATFGVVTWVFAKGHGIELFGATANGYVSNFIPLLMLALLFGLSTDYEVFLISRVQEHYEETRNNEESMAVGIEATGPLISGAALLMIAVFIGFAFSSMLPIQTLGFGMAVAIFLDATIVRLVIVPAAMKLMGKWNWWMPGRRRRNAVS